MSYKTRKRLKALEEDGMEGSGFFQNLIKKAFGTVSDMIVKPPNFDPNKVKYGWLRRPFDMPPLYDLSEMVAATYKPEADNPDIQGYTLLAKTPTLAFFQVQRKKNVIIIAIRGTALSDLNDITADLGILKSIVVDANTARNVRNSRRYASDVAEIEEFKELAEKYLPRKKAVLKYYAVGHSLSGSIIDELLEDGLVSSAVSFNPAIERVMLDIPNDNHRIYIECDVLYQLLGKFITNGNLEVVPKENPAGADAGAVDTTKGSLSCHTISTVVPLMSGRGYNNNIGIIERPMTSFNELIKNPSSLLKGLDRFKPIGSPCDRILQEPVSQDVGPNSGRERQRKRYEACLANDGKEPEAPPPRHNPYDMNYRNPVRSFDQMLKGEGFAGDMWRRGKKELGIKEPEPNTSHPIFDYTNRDAVEKRFYGGMEGTGFFTDALAGSLFKGAKGLYNLSKAESNPFAHAPSTRTTPYLPPLIPNGGGFLGDMKEKFKNRGKTPEQIESEKAYQQNAQDALRGIPPTVEFMTRWLNDRSPSAQEKALRGMTREEFFAKIGANYKRWQDSVGISGRYIPSSSPAKSGFFEGVKGVIDAFDPSTYGRGGGFLEDMKTARQDAILRKRLAGGSREGEAEMVQMFRPDGTSAMVPRPPAMSLWGMDNDARADGSIRQLSLRNNESGRRNMARLTRGDRLSQINLDRMNDPDNIQRVIDFVRALRYPPHLPQIDNTAQLQALQARLDVLRPPPPPLPRDINDDPDFRRGRDQFISEMRDERRAEAIARADSQRGERAGRTGLPRRQP